MKETLGKRIVHHRKRLGFTQDALAEKLGVTAQAISKWENDQSCTDITMLPKLAGIFETTTDSLLGLEVPVREIPSENSDQAGLHVDNKDGNWSIQLNTSRKTDASIALWVLMIGGILLAANLLSLQAELWTVVWTSGLLIFGLSGLFPKFSFFRFGCGLAGIYFLGNALWPGLFALATSCILPVFLLLFGSSLLFDALRKSREPQFHFSSGNIKRHTHHYHAEDETFTCNVSFGEIQQSVELPRLRKGIADISFGELTVDLRSCESFSEDCVIDAKCSFGELTLLLPQTVQAEVQKSTSFGELNISGHPDASAPQRIRINCVANFGEITLCYL